MKIGIVGSGIVGSSLINWFRDKSPIIYDRGRNKKNLGRLQKEAELIFVCVPTPYGKRGYDDYAVYDVMSKLLKYPGKVIVIKSTVLPGTTEKLQTIYPMHTFLFNPEFLTEKNHVKDFMFPDRQIIGTTEKSIALADVIMKMLPHAPYERIMNASTAEMIKYAGNTFLALKITYANQLFDICSLIGIDYELVRDGMGADPRIGKSHTSIWMDGERGYSGMCLPKDSKALIDFAHAHGTILELLNTMDRLNGQYQKQKGGDIPWMMRTNKIKRNQQKVNNPRKTNRRNKKSLK